MLDIIGALAGGGVGVRKYARYYRRVLREKFYLGGKVENVLGISILCTRFERKILFRG